MTTEELRAIVAADPVLRYWLAVVAEMLAEAVEDIETEEITQ